MSWLIYAGLVVLGASGIHIFAKMSVDNPLSNSFALVVTMVAALGTALIYYVFRNGAKLMPEGYAASALIYPALVGVCIAIAHLAIFHMYTAQAPLSIAMPIVRMGAVVITVLAGVMFFREQLALINYVGIVLAIAAVIMITR